MSKIVIYGSYGYTGNLIAELCSAKKLPAVLSGRNEQKLQEQSQRTKLPYQAVSLNDKVALENLLEKATLVLHCAGPFEHTARPMMEACLATKTHYVDITGEIKVFELAAALDKKFKNAEIMALPGGGFDVVPSDCMAAFLKSELPDATELKLAIRMKGRISHGTATTMVENIGEGGAVRKNGRITRVPAGYKSTKVDFGDGKKRDVTTIPWGDISTAWHSTKIPNIEVYAAIPAKAFRLSRWFGWILATGPFQKFLKKKIKSQPAGPSEKERQTGKSFVWGEAKNESGKTVSAIHDCPEGYTLTALTAVLIGEKILNGKFKTGFQTPSLAYGADLILEIDGAKRIIN